ncbi:MAG: histidine kinase, partial [Rhodothermales bacterium]|nr:histidine kinase [Rhodothermales bacterium]
RLDRMVSRALTYVAVLGLIFFAFVGIKSLIDPLVAARGWPENVVSGGLVVILLLVFERFAMRARVYFTQFFATDRERAARLLDRLQERVRDFVDVNSLLQESVHVVGRAFDVRSAVLFVQTSDNPEMWTSASYRPEPPYLTERIVRSLWPHFKSEARVWAFNPELNLSTLEIESAMLLLDRGAVLAIPIKGKEKPVGLLVLGRKNERRAVYNVEDVDRLRSFAGHLVLAIDRLELVEKQKELVRQSSEAQMMALRAQINPHFLFNALNTIAASIDERPDLAESTVESLAQIFRYTLQTGNKPFVTLRNELRLVRNYLDIEQARFGDRLSVEIDVSPDHLDLQVPAFAVQTLVENAVKHGIEKGRSEGGVRIATSYDGTQLTITVADTGVGIPALFGGPPSDAQSFFGIGLQNVTARLEYLYGRKDLLEIESLPEEGTTVTLRVPNRDDAVREEETARAVSEAPTGSDHRQHAPN